MGAYRLVLAVLVLLSHLHKRVGGHNPGVAAVISFLLLSGFVMTALIRRHYATPNRIPMFFADRAMRLFPQFLLYMLLTVALVKTAPVSSIFLSKLTYPKIVLNVLMLPLGFYMFGLEHAILMPQAWSLGLEVTFYMIFPFLLIYRLERAAFALSVVVFLLAYVGMLDNDIYGYRLLPGTLFIFLCGSLLHGQSGARRKRFLKGVYLVAALMFIPVTVVPWLPKVPSVEVFVGFLVGLPMVAILSKKQSSFWDELAGNLSYGVFLNHMFIIWCFEAAGVSTRGSLKAVLIILCSMLLAWLSYRFVERPVITYRHRLREKQEAEEATAAHMGSVSA